MDVNKEKKLSEIEYSIQECCGLCKYAHISLDGWGICNLHKYKHAKHTGEERQLSINQFGYCAKFVLDEYKTHDLHAYSKFLQRPCPTTAALDWNKPFPRDIFTAKECEYCGYVHSWALMEATRQARLEVLKK